MRYIATIETDDYKDFKFFEDADGKYLIVKDANAKHDEWISLHFTECEQEPKTVHWIKWYVRKENDWVIENIPHYKCSECGGEPYYSNTIYHYKFCPYCGAKMVEPQESEDKE